MKQICIHDPSLRDGSHASNHQLSLAQVQRYVKAMDTTGVDVIEVGHGLGLGASSLQLGFSKHSDDELLQCARENIKNAKLGVHITPGYGNKKDLAKALAYSVDTLRVAAHCSEADITESLIKDALDKGITVYAALTMSHMLSAEALVQQALLIQSYGAKGVVLMDSAGAYLPHIVTEKISLLCREVDLQIGFHAHNNLGLAVANSLAAVQAGASIIDGTAKGFGAGAGNTPLELIVAVLQKIGACEHIDLSKLLWACDDACEYLVKPLPRIKSTNIMSGIHGVFCGFDQKVCLIAEELNLEPLKIYQELGKQRIIAGQEDKIIEVAYQLHEEQKS